MDNYEKTGHRLSEIAEPQLVQGHSPHSGCYFSFPSFDTWEEGQEHEEQLMGRPA